MGLKTSLIKTFFLVACKWKKYNHFWLQISQNVSSHVQESTFTFINIGSAKVSLMCYKTVTTVPFSLANQDSDILEKVKNFCETSFSWIILQIKKLGFSSNYVQNIWFKFPEQSITALRWRAENQLDLSSLFHRRHNSVGKMRPA